MHYLRTGKFLPGSSSKHCKRVKKLADKYILEDYSILYLPDPEDTTKTRIVPKIEDRFELIKHEHIPGHFSYNKIGPIIKEKYYWKNMNGDIEYILKHACKA
jgi:hypothetical protein